MLTHPNILNDDGTPVLFHLQSTIDYILWMRREVKIMRQERLGRMQDKSHA